MDGIDIRTDPTCEICCEMAYKHLRYDHIGEICPSSCHVSCPYFFFSNLAWICLRVSIILRNGVESSSESHRVCIVLQLLGRGPLGASLGRLGAVLVRGRRPGAQHGCPGGLGCLWTKVRVGVRMKSVHLFERSFPLSDAVIFVRTSDPRSLPARKKRVRSKTCFLAALLAGGFLLW